MYVCMCINGIHDNLKNIMRTYINEVKSYGITLTIAIPDSPEHLLEVFRTLPDSFPLTRLEAAEENSRQSGIFPDSLESWRFSYCAYYSSP